MIYKITREKEKQIIHEVSQDDCFFFLSMHQEIGLDIETTKKYEGKVFGEKEGLDPYTSDIIMIQLGNKNVQYVIDARKIMLEDLVQIIAQLRNKIIVGHNLKFEYKHILHNYGIRLDNLYDTMIAEMVLECGNGKARYSLKHLIGKYLGKETSDEVDKSIRMQFLTIGDNPFTEEQILYGAGDILYPMSIKEAQLRKMRFLDLLDTFAEESRFLPALASLEYNGMYINQEKWLDIYRQNIEKYYKAENQLNSYLETNPDLFSPFLDENKKCSILWTSPKQVIPVMQTVGVDTWVKDKLKTKQTGKQSFKHSVEAKHLRNYMQFELVRIYMKYKNFQKYVTSYGEEFLRHVNPITNRIHPDIWQIVSTGRTSCKDPNLQNITSGEFRSCFTPQEEDNVLISCDFSHRITGAAIQ